MAPKKYRELDRIQYKTKKDLELLQGLFYCEEEGGFEPPERSSRSTVFKTVPFNHSGIPPCVVRI